MHIRHRLRLHSLRGVHDDQRPFAGRKRAGNFVREIHMPRRIQQIQPIGVAVLRLVAHRHRMRLDRDAPLALEVHRIQKLILRIAHLDCAGEFEQTVGERRFPVIDMGDDAEISGA